MTNPRNKTINNAPLVKRPPPPKSTPVNPIAERRKQSEPSKPKKPKRIYGYPLKSRHIDTCRFFKASKSSKIGVHEVDRVERNGVISYYKANEPGSPMSEIEACNWAFYHFLVPKRVPGKANAHYDDNGVFQGVSLQELPGFVSAMEDPLTMNDLLDEEIIIGNAEGLTASWIFVEDDCHRNNISKDGKRIDFDNSNFPISGRFKPSGWVEGKFRPYDKFYFPPTARDTVNFPVLTDSQLFYWPTKPGLFFRDNTREAFEYWTKIPISKNAFTEKENPVYAHMKSIPLFVRQKFHILLKFILTPDKIWQTIANQHIRGTLMVPGTNIKAADAMSDFVIERKNLFREILLELPEFHQFFLQHGETSLKIISDEMIARNKELLSRTEHKIKKHPHHQLDDYFDTRVNPMDLRAEFYKIKREVNYRYAEGQRRKAITIAGNSW